MVDVVVVPSQLQQWTFEKSIVRPDRSDSAATSPDLYDSEAVRISPAAVESPQDLETSEPLIQEMYLSSEEDLSPMEPDSSEGNLFEDGDDYLSAKHVSVSSSDGLKTCDLAVVVSYVSAGRPKIVNLPNVASPVRERTVRSASLANLPAAVTARLAHKPSRLSISTSFPSTSSVPSSLDASRRPSTAKHTFSQDLNDLKIKTSSPSTESLNRNSTSSPSTASSSFKRPTTARASSSQYSASSRASFHLASTRSPLSPFPPLTPTAVQTPSFLSSDPFAATESASTAAPQAKNAPYKRLRSISRTLSLAKIAVIPTYKKVEPKTHPKNGVWQPSTPVTPQTPMSAPAPSSSSSSPATTRPRRNSKMVARGANEREPAFELPPVPPELEEPRPKPQMMKMVPRGADERAPMIELPPFPVEEGGKGEVAQVKTNRVKKRKSLMDFERLTHRM
ncbi:hypothetical protein K432DRAFT_403188 [Lepidopterella palustris CBS 459.81]|uniref:Uncharacterized protein n=1 Tax=Lepidopterella palustris CBS 459.81 TaxID=1314670 RepID=A0A8E2EDQ0_9PEZI|nr:hypothetical protein K432DRAFT_403188 [Lepidopterella palustris CBS 459.81]